MMPVCVNAYLNLPPTGTLLISNVTPSDRDKLLMSTQSSLMAVSKKHKKLTGYKNKTKIRKRRKKRERTMLKLIESNWLDFKKNTTNEEPPNNLSKKQRNQLSSLVSELQEQTKRKRTETEESNTILESETEYLVSKHLVMSSFKKEKQMKKSRHKKVDKKSHNTPPKNETNKEVSVRKESNNDEQFDAETNELLSSLENTKEGTIQMSVSKKMPSSKKEKHLKKSRHKAIEQKHCNTPPKDQINKQLDHTPSLRSVKTEKSDSNKDLPKKLKNEVTNSINKFFLQVKNEKFNDAEGFDAETKELLSSLENDNREHIQKEHNTKKLKLEINITKKSPQKEKTLGEEEESTKSDSKMVELSLLLKQTIEDTTKISPNKTGHKINKTNGQDVNIKNVHNKMQSPSKKTHKNSIKEDENLPHDDESFISTERFLEQTLEVDETNTITIHESDPFKSTEMDEFDLSYSDIEEMLETKLEEEEENSQKNTQKLRNLQIVLPFKVPRSHKIETRFTAPMTKEQNEQVKEMGIEYKSGPYTKTEDETIKDNFREFCKLHDLKHDARPFLLIRNILVTERANFVRFLGRNLKNRQLYSIYKRFKTLFNEQKKGQFTPNEDAIIITFMKRNKHKKNPFVKLAKLLTRDPIAVHKHYVTLKGVKVNHDRFVLDEAKLEEFLRSLQKVIHITSIEDLKDRTIEKDEWEKIAKRMEMPAIILKNTWLRTIHPRIFVKTPFGKVAKDVLLRLYEMNVKDWREVQWKEIAKHFDGCNPLFLCRLISRCVWRFVKTGFREHARKCIKYLLKLHKDDLVPREPKRIRWEDGLISYYVL